MQCFSITSALFVPATRPERFAKAAQSGADLVVLDLEDAVAEADKDQARAALIGKLEGVLCAWRINGFDSPHHGADVSRLFGQDQPDLVMLPKAEAGEAFESFSQNSPPIIALIETAKGMADARALAAHPKVVVLAFGTLDFCVDLGADHLNALLDTMRVELVMASRLAGITAPIDGVTTDLSDPLHAENDSRHAKSLGMGGKLAIHPNQVAAIAKAYRPTEAEIAWAKKVMAVEGGVEKLDGQMVDAPVKARAARILARI